MPTRFHDALQPNPRVVPGPRDDFPEVRVSCRMHKCLLADGRLVYSSTATSPADGSESWSATGRLTLIGPITPCSVQPPWVPCYHHTVYLAHRDGALLGIKWCTFGVTSTTRIHDSQYATQERHEARSPSRLAYAYDFPRLPRAGLTPRGGEPPNISCPSCPKARSATKIGPQTGDMICPRGGTGDLPI